MGRNTHKLSTHTALPASCRCSRGVRVRVYLHRDAHLAYTHLGIWQLPVSLGTTSAPPPPSVPLPRSLLAQQGPPGTSIFS